MKKKKKRNWFARFLALIALIAAVAALVVVAKNTDLHSSDSNSKGQNTAQTHSKQQRKPRTKAKKYVVKSGDTLTSISHKTGIPVAELQALNPEIDPQILVEGETLKLQK